jgi:hypothetical protein
VSRPSAELRNAWNKENAFSQRLQQENAFRRMQAQRLQQGEGILLQTRRMHSPSNKENAFSL